MEYYGDRRYLLKSEVELNYPVVLVVSKNGSNQPLFELYRKDGIRIGKLDPKRGWAAKILNDHTPQPKEQFIEQLLCDEAGKNP